MTKRQLGYLNDAHKEHISKQREIPLTGTVKREDLDKVANRAALLTLLDIILEIHRVKHSSDLSPLKGRKALTHLILTKYNWPIDVINKMSVADSIIAIQDILVSSEPSELAKQHLDAADAKYLYASFDDLPDSDWNPLIHESYLRLRD